MIYYYIGIFCLSILIVALLKMFPTHILTIEIPCVLKITIGSEGD